MATIYSYNSNNRWCTYTLTMARDSNDNNKVVITATGSINTSNTSGGDSSGTIYAQLRYGVSPAQTAANPAKNATGTTTFVENYGTLISDGWTIKSVVTKGSTTNTYSSTKIVTGPTDSSSSPSNPYNFTITWTKTTNDAISLSNVALFFFKSATSTTAPSNGSYAFIGKKVDLNANYSRYYTQALSVGVGYTACKAPTSVTSSVTIQKPGAPIVISWKNADGGTSNAITGYTLYYRRGAAPTTETYDGKTEISSTVTEDSHTYSSFASNSYRGSTYYFKVVTKGAAGSSYYSTISSAQATCKVNSLPTLSSVSANKNIIARNSATSVTFTLSGAANDGTLSFRYATSNSTSSTTGITNGASLSVAAGTSNVTYYFWAYDGLEYSTSQSITLTRNTLPTAPTISTNKTIVKSGGDNVTFGLTATPGDTGQSISYYYATSASGTKTAFTSGSTINVKATTTYYFWAWDGLDFSSSSNKTITVNTPPTYSNTSMSGGTLYNSQILSSEQNKIFRLNDTASLTASTSTGGTLTYQWYYQMSDLSGDAVVGNTSATWNVISGATTNSYSTNNNIFKTRGKIYRLKCRITDQLTDYTDVIYVWRIIAPTPTIMMVGNAGSASSPSYVDVQSSSESFKNTLIFNVSYDSSLSGQISSCSISSGSSVSIEVDSVSYGTTTHNVAFATSGIQKDTSYTISFTMAGETGAPPAEMSKTLSTAADPVGLTLEQTYSTNPFKPFSGGDNKYSFTLNGINQTNYNLNNDNAITQIDLKYGNNIKHINFERDSSTSTGNYLILKFTQDQILDTNFIPEANWNTNQTITINSITMKDIFEFSHTVNFSANNSIEITFKEGLITNSTRIDSINGKTTSNTYYIYEGTNQLTYNLSYAAYNTNQQVSCEAYIYRSNSIINPTSISNWGNIYATTTFTTGDERTENVVSENKNVSFNVNQIYNSQYLYFKLILKLNNIATEIIYSSTVIHFKGVKHIEPTAIITSTISGDNTIIILKSSNSGADPTNKMRQNNGYQVGLQFSETNTFNTNTIKYLKVENGIGSLTNGDDYQDILNPSGTPFEDEITLALFNTQESFSGNWERYYVRLIYRTFDPNGLEKRGWSSPITIFNMFPTISYRPNRVGINTKRVDEFTSNTGSIVIGAMNENSKIFILKTGQTQATIDLTTGKIDGFTLDGGTW